MAVKKIYVILPYREEFADVYEAIVEAARRVETLADDSQAEVYRLDRRLCTTTVTAREAISSADLIVADISMSDDNVWFEVGLAQAMEKPLVLIQQRETMFALDRFVPFDSLYRVILYDRASLRLDLVPHLADDMTIAFRDPQQYIEWARKEEPYKVPSAFVSYSHADRQSLDRLLVHLKPLEKRGLLDVWADTMIRAGDRWEQEVSNALDRAAIAVLLVSADFLASDFIIDNEMPPLLQGAREKGTMILPVILKPCRFARDRNLSQFQALNPPSEPVLLLSPVEQEVIWDRVAYAIEAEIESKAV